MSPPGHRKPPDRPRSEGFSHSPAADQPKVPGQDCLDHLHQEGDLRSAASACRRASVDVEIGPLNVGELGTQAGGEDGGLVGVAGGEQVAGHVAGPVDDENGSF